MVGELVLLVGLLVHVHGEVRARDPDVVEEEEEEELGGGGPSKGAATTVPPLEERDLVQRG